MIQQIDCRADRLYITDSYFPSAVLENPLSENTVWYCDFEVSIYVDDAFPDEADITIQLSYWLYEKGVPFEEEQLLSIAVCINFDVKGAKSYEGKLLMLQNLTRIAVANAQGAYAAKTENTSAAHTLPPDYCNEEKLKTALENDWK